MIWTTKKLCAISEQINSAAREFLRFTAKIAGMETTHIMAKGWKKSFGDTNAPLVISFLELPCPRSKRCIKLRVEGGPNLQSFLKPSALAIPCRCLNWGSSSSSSQESEICKVNFLIKISVQVQKGWRCNVFFYLFQKWNL